MNWSLQIRRRKALNRARDRRRLTSGKLRVDQVSIAAGVCSGVDSPLVLRRVRLAEHEYLLDEDE